MIAELGTFAFALALALSIAQSGLSIAARVKGSAPLRGAGEGAAAGAFLAILLAFACLLTVFIRSDFSVMNVAQHSHTAKPLLYKIAGSWGSHEGSMALWCLALTAFGAVVALTGRNLPWKLKTLTVATQGWLGVLFIAYTLFASNPFARVPNPPVEGSSLNPILQDPALAFHPPLLYLGYVGFSVVFSFAVAALIEGKVDAAWARWVRPWTLAAWSFLTVGITLGSFWAYYELGWGGWWFWDSVENASFMPWLIGTALLHSAIVTEKRNAFQGWTVFLALASFTFAMLGTFLVRSGAIMSVHAFAVDPTRGVILLMIMALAAGTGFTLFAWRASKFGGGGVYAPVSRETALLLNNLFLAAATAGVLVGTLYPLFFELVFGRPMSVGVQYFNLVFGVIMGAALVVMPVGPLLAWKRGDLKGALQRLTVAVGLALAGAIAAFALVSPNGALAAIGTLLGVWLIAGTLTELAERAKVGRASASESLRRLGGLPRGAWGMTLAHIGIGVFAIGACIEIAGKVQASEVMIPGDSFSVGSYELRLDAIEPVDGPNYLADRATITATKNGAPVCVGQPQQRTYPTNGTTTSEVAICNEGLSHLYMVLGEERLGADGVSRRLVTGYFNPWAWLIFMGPILMALGGVVSLSDRRLRLGVGRKAAPARKPGKPAKPVPA
jgi:cytochrome c-type biogenesis protein CcmF